MRCRHSKTWIITAGSTAHIVWCYGCGAIRTSGYPDANDVWIKPVGPEGKNPWDDAVKRAKRLKEKNS